MRVCTEFRMLQLVRPIEVGTWEVAVGSTSHPNFKMCSSDEINGRNMPMKYSQVSVTHSKKHKISSTPNLETSEIRNVRCVR